MSAHVKRILVLCSCKAVFIESTLLAVVSELRRVHNLCIGSNLVIASTKIF